MSMELLAQAVFLGIIEGLTEFIPVSSTGHLILLVDLLGFQGPPGRVFEIAIQLGAILAVVLLYFGRLWKVALALPTEPIARLFVFNVVVAFLPAALVGVVAHGFIKSVLFSPYVVSIALILGGIVILLVEAWLPEPREREVLAFSPWLALKIGAIQCLAMIPGVSRAGATIIGAMALGVERRAATEFSFFLAMPTMLGAVVYDLYKNWRQLDFDNGLVIAVGFLAAFLAGGLVVRWLVGFVSRHGFQPFGWYRIAVGSAMLALLLWA
jgi:undecaprenyl-diphosphatase